MNPTTSPSPFVPDLTAALIRRAMTEVALATVAAMALSVVLKLAMAGG